MSKSLEQIYQELDNIDRFIIQLLSILYEDTPRSKVLEFVNRARQQSNIGSLTGDQFNDRVRKLMNCGLIPVGSGSNLACHPEVRETVARHAARMGTLGVIANSIHSAYPSYEFSLYFHSKRELRLAIYQKDVETIQQMLTNPRLPNFGPLFKSLLILIFNKPFDLEWFEEFPQTLQINAIQAILEESAWECTVAQEAFEILKQWFEQGTLLVGTRKMEPGSPVEMIQFMYVEQLWLRGQLQEATQQLTTLSNNLRHTSDYELALLGTIAFLGNRLEESLIHYRRALSMAKSQKAKVQWFLSYPCTLIYFFAALKDGRGVILQEAKKYAEMLYQSSGWLSNAMPPLLKVLAQRQGTPIDSKELEPFINYRFEYQNVPALLEVYCLYWLNIPGFLPRLLSHLKPYFAAAFRADYHWIALEMAELLTRLDHKSDVQEIVESVREPNCLPLLQTLEQKEAWELSLNALSELAGSGSTSTKTAESRIVWRIEVKSSSRWTIAPFEQKWGSRGWTVGKPIVLKRLTGSGIDETLPFTDQDRKICQCIMVERNSGSRYGSGKTVYSFGPETIVALVGHPHVYWESSPTIRVEIVKGEPELTVKQAGEHYLHLQLVPNLTQADKYLVVKETPTRLKVIEVKESYQRIAALLGPKNCLAVPLAAKEKVLTTIASLSTLVTVQSDIGGGVAAEEVPADPKPRLHLIPAGEGLRVSMLVHPFAEGGAYYEPGKGGATVIAEVEGKRLQAQRDLKDEKKRAKAVMSTCPVLQQYKPQGGEWHIEIPEDCLELLLQLQTLGDEVQIEWPQGEKFRVSRLLSFADFKVQLRAQQDWFAASGEVQISPDQVLDLRQLMALLDTAPGKFIPLSDGQFLALTDEFRKRIETLHRLTENTSKGLRIHNLAALGVEDLLAEVDQLEVDRTWTQNLKRIKAAQTFDPPVPQTLQATLRDYQVDGFRWLARLAQWGVGACLADDMGLGKTVQVLTLILSRAQDGPTLVLAPTSVGMNWISESDRFAPSLNVKTLLNGDRQKLLEEMGPQDLLVCSYGLLQQDEVAEKLAQVQWHTIVLDEAQAIKNAATKRSQAAMALSGNFKIITTGTPIENHLGELWNLFRFINPGLLGSLESFNQRFGYPIERDQDAGARDALRRLIQPFLLRRTKDQVLKELPSRTEITLQVELSTEEMAFYEALRQESLEKLANTNATAGAKHLQVLAEIMRLRRACCNPRLVRPELALPSAKLEQFGEVLEELLESGHKALVFSQFVDHLTILREYLESQKVTYQYLDGSTPVKQRKQRVDAFQNGEGDVFLISLKAGGSGLNLTAADYVIHMDPWWNPAVEDQASDRAHRMGQHRPVTIYRLVAQGTIEEKIVDLHQSKRDLADSLLEGADVSGKISTEELLALLSQR
jgi:superfamily II DNA or RNA helicase